MTAAQGHNAGSKEDKRKALDSIYDYNKTLITLATGTIALSATFLGKDLYRGVGLPWLVWSWILLGGSILFGLFGLGAYISQYAESDIKPRRGTSEYLSLVQVLALLAGLALLGSFAVKNATHAIEKTAHTKSINPEG